MPYGAADRRTVRAARRRDPAAGPGDPGRPAAAPPGSGRRPHRRPDLDPRARTGPESAHPRTAGRALSSSAAPPPRLRRAAPVS
ncbi:hypothetical protein DMB38_26965 [Streptomyces sp. WAC 06738]|nr:hypothetical protein DMB38_26965 [Streptomyces sp. WAC 06738]